MERKVEGGKAERAGPVLSVVLLLIGVALVGLGGWMIVDARAQGRLAQDYRAWILERARPLASLAAPAPRQPPGSRALELETIALVHGSGLLEGAQELQDPELGVRTLGLRLERSVEMYQWKEDRITVGRDEDQEVRYEYREVWSGTRIRSEEFRNAGGHSNPPWPAGLEAFGANAAAPTLAGYKLPARLVAQLPRVSIRVGPEDLARIDPLHAEGMGARDGVFYRGAAGPGAAIGDLRIAFLRIDSQPVTVLAGTRGDAFVGALGPSGGEIFRLKPGTVEPAVLADELAEEMVPRQWLVGIPALLLILPGLGLLVHLVRRGS